MPGKGHGDIHASPCCRNQRARSCLLFGVLSFLDQSVLLSSVVQLLSSVAHCSVWSVVLSRILSRLAFRQNLPTFKL